MFYSDTLELPEITDYSCYSLEDLLLYTLFQNNKATYQELTHVIAYNIYDTLVRKEIIDLVNKNYIIPKSYLGDNIYYFLTPAGAYETFARFNSKLFYTLNVLLDNKGYNKEDIDKFLTYYFHHFYLYKNVDVNNLYKDYENWSKGEDFTQNGPILILK